MKQTWKSLKSLICKKQEWIKDSEQSSCSCCNKPFVRIFRRKHHCRSCGRLFCSNCSQHYINGTYIDQNFQKYLRLCEFCNQKVEISLRELNIRLEEQLPDDQSDDKSSSTDSDDLDMLFPIFEQSSYSRNEKQLKQQIKDKIDKLSTYLCEQHWLQPRWIKTLADFALLAGDEVSIDSISRKNSMDINKSVKIEVVECSDPKCTRLFKGYVCDNNVISKQMKTNFSKPKVIIIMGSIEISYTTEEKMKFQDLITKQKPMLRNILGKLIKLNPTLIFVEEIVTYTAKQYLASKGISVVCKNKPEALENIKKVTNVRKTIDKLYKVETYKQEQVIGTCQKIYFQKHQNGEDKEKTLLYIEDSNSEIISIVLAHAEQSKLHSLKFIMEELLKISRQMWLQKQLIETEEFKLMKSNKYVKNGFISFLNKHVTIERLLTIKGCTFSRAKYTPLKLSNFPDVENMGQIQSYKKNTPFIFNNVLKKHWELCNTPTMLTKMFYSQDDISIGGFYLLEIANMNLNCENCEKPKKTHVNMFHYENRFAKVWLETSKEEPEKIAEAEENKEVNMYISKETLHVHLRQKFKGQAMNSRRKLVYYIECAQCNQILSDESSVSKNFLENSFQYFLLKLLVQEQIFVQTEEGILYKCQHRILNRVIKSEDGALKIQTGKLKLYSVSDIDLNSQQAKQYLLQQDLAHINSLSFTELLKIKQYLNSIVSELTILEASSTQGLSKRGLKYRQIESKLVLASQNLDYYIDQVKQKFSSNLQLTMKDYTPVKKQIDKISYYLEIIYKIFLKIDNFHKKDRKEEDETEIQDLLENSVMKLQSSAVEINTNLTNLKKYLEPYKTIEWGTDQEMNQYSYAPIFKQNPVSLVAFALNTKNYSKSKQADSEIIIKIQYGQKPEMQYLCSLLNPITQFLKIENKSNKEDHEVKILFPKLFSEIRNQFGIDDQLYIKSLIDCHDLHTTAGKSNAEFKKSFNHLLIIKEIKDKQFIQFEQFFIEYYKHMSKTSYLSKIFGMYEVDRKRCLIVMQNISFMIDTKLPASFIQYDLKGSDFKRFAHQNKDGEKITRKDTNFKFDRNGEPLYLKADDYDILMNALSYDNDFLQQQGVIDYSLLLIIDLEKNTLRMGIIDFMRPFKLFELFELIYKKMISGNDPTVVQPKQYKQRFFSALQKYFLRSATLQ